MAIENLGGFAYAYILRGFRFYSQFEEIDMKPHKPKRFGFLQVASLANIFFVVDIFYQPILHF